MIEDVSITRSGVEYTFRDEAPDDARGQLADAGDPTNPTKAEEVLENDQY